MHAGERPKETAEVVALQNYLTECREKRIFKLKDEIKKAAERVIFLLHHATLDGEFHLEMGIYYSVGRYKIRSFTQHPTLG